MTARRPTILIVDDDPQLQRLLHLTLQQEGYATLHANTGQEALAIVKRDPPDLILLDVLLPDIRGYTLCQDIRAFSHVPLMFLSILDQPTDIVYGVDQGADDYLPKPFSMEVLLARIRRLFRRTRAPAPSPVFPLVVGDLTIVGASHVVIRGQTRILLGPKEFAVLLHLAQHAGCVVPWARLMEHIGDQDQRCTRHQLQAIIMRLRRKIEPDPTHPRYLVTKPGVGYLLQAPPSALPTP